MGASGSKSIVFLTAISTLINISTVLYLLERSSDRGFTSSLRATYWAVVAMTTVGYRYIARRPRSAAGRDSVRVLGSARGDRPPEPRARSCA